MKNNKDKINKKIIQKYKKDISNELKCEVYDLKERMKNTIEEKLDLALKNHKINAHEYDVLNDYLQKILEDYFNMDVQLTSETNSEESRDKNKEFRQKIKDSVATKVSTVYQGEVKETTQEINRESINKDIKKEGEEI